MIIKFLMNRFALNIKKLKLFWDLIDTFFVLLFLGGILTVIWQGVHNKNQDFIILSISCIPFLLNKILMGLVKKETIFQGASNVVKRNEDPNLYWLIIFIYAIFFSISAFYLLIKFFLI